MADINIDEIRKRAMQAKERAAASMKKTIEKSEEQLDKILTSHPEQPASAPAAAAEEQAAANAQRQVEILGQVFGPDSMAQMAANEELLQKMVNDQIAQAAGMTAESIMEQLFGEEMGVLAVEMESAALYMTAAKLGKRALAICSISDSLVTGEELSAEERQTTFTTMMRIALETAVAMESK